MIFTSFSLGQITSHVYFHSSPNQVENDLDLPSLKLDMWQSIMSQLSELEGEIWFGKKRDSNPLFLGPWPTIVNIDQQWRHQTLRKWLLRNKDKIISDFETYHWVPGQFSTFFLFLAFYSTVLLFLVRVDLNFYHIFQLFFSARKKLLWDRSAKNWESAKTRRTLCLIMTFVMSSMRKLDRKSTVKLFIRADNDRESSFELSM